MANNVTSPPEASPVGQAQNAPGSALTPELVREVTDKVYALWLLDLKIERERWRQRLGGGFHRGEG